ncbi:alpha/beta-hydrolase [Glonium stellatum]|uniref:Alpha/beta-hydrolase n=1 Tax=Glonium stellatum TaxID=574774 RepID=A0A8E2EQW5_9PEZI|nr:alpha/beta-hydrolase [Glonium stellatum]
MAAIPVTLSTKEAAGRLATIAYTDYSDPDTFNPKPDIAAALRAMPSSANGPYELLWGPSVNNGILSFVAQSSVDQSYAIAFRGSLNSDADAVGYFTNWADDLLGLMMVPWKYPQSAGAYVSSGMNDALALAVAATDPDSGTTMVDFLREQLRKAPNPIMTTGHSLGAAMANIAAVWLKDQVPRADGPADVGVTPFTFAAPTVTDKAFAGLFGTLCPVAYHCMNTLDIVPMAWTNILGVQTSFPSPGQTLLSYNFPLWLAVGGAAIITGKLGYTALPGTLDKFQGPDPKEGTTYATEAGTQHWMQGTYLPHVLPSP